MPIAQRCENCWCFVRHLAGSNDGECRRHAPVAMIAKESPGESWAFWPSVELDDWCGEWALRDNQVRGVSAGERQAADWRTKLREGY